MSINLLVLVKLTPIYCEVAGISICNLKPVLQMVKVNEIYGGG
jgi:hypothetical protein